MVRSTTNMHFSNTSFRTAPLLDRSKSYHVVRHLAVRASCMNCPDACFAALKETLSSPICCLHSLTDVFAGVALMNEPSEAAIMQEKPRNFKKQRLVDIRLIGYSYLIIGNIISIGMRYD